jgi:hypothetical protein
LFEMTYKIVPTIIGFCSNSCPDTLFCFVRDDIQTCSAIIISCSAIVISCSDHNNNMFDPCSNLF